MPNIASRIISLIITLWVAKVFLLSLPYKFTNHPDTQHIFNTIGQWMGDTISQGLGQFFANYAAYIIGSIELTVSITLLIASTLWILAALKIRASAGPYQMLYFFGGLFASATMTGAAFFHLFTPLGVEVLHEGGSDGGSLFYAAVSILFLGLVLAFLNKPQAQQ
jgi:hypothetical protein